MSEQNASWIGKINDLPTEDISNHILGGVKRVVFGPDRFWPDYVMRAFTLQPGAVAPPNVHEWMHWAVCIQGEGRIIIDGVEHDFSRGSWMHTPPHINHTFWNTSDTEEFVLLCIVPPEGDVNPLHGPVAC